MNFKTTIILLALAAIGAAAWLVVRRVPSPAPEESSKPPTPAEARYVLDPRPGPNDVVRVRLERRDEPVLVFERQPKQDEPQRMENWRMVAPLESDTESYLVDGLAHMALELQAQRSFTPGAASGVSLADAGLEPPLATMTLTDKDDKQYGVEIGAKAALSNGTYVRLPGADEIILVERDLSHEIKHAVSDYRAKNVLKLSAGDARHLRIEHAGKTYDLTRGAKDEWVINEPIKAYARTDKVQALIRALGSVRVKEFVEDAPESLAAYGLATPLLTISVTTEKKEPVAPKPAEPNQPEEPTTQPVEPRFELVTQTHELTVGDYADLGSTARYLKLPDRPWVASATTDQLDKLIPKLSELRDPQVTRVKARDATRLELTSAGATVTLEKRGGRWQGTGDLAELEREAVDKLLAAFEDVSAIDYVDDPQDLAAYGLDRPRAVLTVGTAGAVEPVALRIGGDTASGRNTYVQVAGQPAVMVISAERAAELAVPPISLRSRVITAGAPEQIKRLSVERGAQRYTLERQADGDKWRMLEPPDAPPDPASVRDLVNDLSRLRARQVVAHDDYASYGLAEPVVTVSFVMEGPVQPTATAPASQPTTQGTQPSTQAATQPAEPAIERVEHTLVVGRKSDKTYARIDDVPYVFELDETVYRVLTEELIERGLFDIRAEDVTSLKIEAPGGTLEFAREEEQWLYPPDKFLKLSQKKVGDFVKELAELRVQAYIAYRDGDLAQYGLDHAPVTVTMRLQSGGTVTLKVDQVRPGELPRKAAWVEHRQIFLLRPAEAEKLMRGLDYYVKTEPETDKEPQPDDE